MSALAGSIPEGFLGGWDAAATAFRTRGPGEDPFMEDDILEDLRVIALRLNLPGPALQHKILENILSTTALAILTSSTRLLPAKLETYLTLRLSCGDEVD